jgi:hypothetical protein
MRRDENAERNAMPTLDENTFTPPAQRPAPAPVPQAVEHGSSRVKEALPAAEYTQGVPRKYPRAHRPSAVQVEVAERAQPTTGREHGSPSTVEQRSALSANGSSPLSGSPPSAQGSRHGRTSNVHGSALRPPTPSRAVRPSDGACPAHPKFENHAQPSTQRSLPSQHSRYDFPR